MSRSTGFDIVVRADGKVFVWPGAPRRRVGQVKTEKVRLSGREHLAGVQREIKTRCVGQVKTGKVSLSGREHLASIQREIKTRCVGQLKTEKTEK